MQGYYLTWRIIIHTRIEGGHWPSYQLTMSPVTAPSFLTNLPCPNYCSLNSHQITLHQITSPIFRINLPCPHYSFLFSKQLTISPLQLPHFKPTKPVPHYSSLISNQLNMSPLQLTHFKPTKHIPITGTSDEERIVDDAGVYGVYGLSQSGSCARPNRPGKK